MGILLYYDHLLGEKGAGMLWFSLVFTVCDVRRSVFTLPPVVVGSLCSVIVCLPGHFCFYEWYSRDSLSTEPNPILQKVSDNIYSPAECIFSCLSSILLKYISVRYRPDRKSISDRYRPDRIPVGHITVRYRFM